MRSVHAGLLLATFLLGRPLLAMQPTSDALLEMGMAQFRDGDLEEALFSLDKAVTRLSEEPGRTRDLVRAYLYLAASYVGLGHDDAARGKFRRALGLDPQLQLSPEEFPARVLQVFGSESLKATAVRSRKGRRTALVLGGLGAAGAVGVALAKGGGNRAPTASISVVPEGEALAGVTRLTFTATANDPEGDPLTYAWELGDGSRASGATAVHVYASRGSYTVTVRVTDSRQGSASAETRVSSGTLTGTWRIEGFAGLDDRPYQCVQAGSAFDCPGSPRSDCGPDGERCNLLRWHGSLADPRRVVATLVLDPKGGPARSGHSPRCLGNVSTDLDLVGCTAETGHTWTFRRQ